MKRFLFLSDTHFRSDSPEARLGDYMQDQFLKLGEIIKLVQEHSVNALIHGGDFFNTKKPLHQLVVDMIDWCKHVGTPIYVVKGNHDITGYNLDSVRNSGLGVLFEAEAVEPLELLEYEKDKIVIKAIHTALDFKQDYMFPEKYKDYFKIIVSHNYVIPADTMPWGFIHPKDIKTNANLVLCGHYHVPFDYSTETTRWINPGPLCRWKINEKDHRPKVLLLEVDNGKCELKEIFLETAKSGDEVFDVNVLKLEQQHNQDIQKFVDSLENVSFQNVDIETIVRQVSREQNISEDVVLEILNRIRKAKEILK